MGPALIISYMEKLKYIYISISNFVSVVSSNSVHADTALWINSDHRNLGTLRVKTIEVYFRLFGMSEDFTDGDR